MRKALIGTVALAAVLTACADSNAAATHAADSITKSVIANDADAVRADMDAQQQPKVTRASVGTLSDVMHKLGDYKGLTLLSADAARSVFTYRADFASGSMNVVVRLDPDGKAAAYRATPNV